MHGCTAPAQLPLTTSIDPRPESRCPSDLREDVCVLRGHRRAWSTRYGIAGTARRAAARRLWWCVSGGVSRLSREGLLLHFDGLAGQMSASTSPVRNSAG
jgi:hypothetical protein